jgi:dinuclear metal center YbgI/SA1388 family protein
VPAQLTDILAEAELLLDPGRFEDYGPNGLQVPGAATVERVATAVSANAELFERAAAEDVQLLLVHHGLFWGHGFQSIDAALKRRLQLLFDNDISLAAYHLPLDAHPEIGNNALLADALGAERHDPFGAHRGQTIGRLAKLPGEGAHVEDLLRQVATITRREPLLQGAGPEQVRHIAIVSGSGADYLQEAAAAGAQALLTGEPVERGMANARELGLHLIAAGHYATETFGIRRLGELLAERFGVSHQFIDVPNPV